MCKEVARASGTGWAEGKPGGRCLALNLQASMGRGYLWIQSGEEGKGCPSPQALWVGLRCASGKGPIAASRHSGKGRSSLMTISVPSLFPLTHQPCSPGASQKPPGDLPLSLCPLQSKATCLSHLLSILPQPCRPPTQSR